MKKKILMVGFLTSVGVFAAAQYIRVPDLFENFVGGNKVTQLGLYGSNTSLLVKLSGLPSFEPSYSLVENPTTPYPVFIFPNDPTKPTLVNELCHKVTNEHLSIVMNLTVSGVAYPTLFWFYKPLVKPCTDGAFAFKSVEIPKSVYFQRTEEYVTTNNFRSQAFLISSNLNPLQVRREFEKTLTSSWVNRYGGWNATSSFLTARYEGDFETLNFTLALNKDPIPSNPPQYFVNISVVHTAKTIAP